ncbi:MAG: hypothetical protein KAR01_08450, partial [Desulfocapsa sp.]|nr:hypothetical protein [Desulfocapsa sp.]
KEVHLFEKVIQWADDDGDTLIGEIVERALADDDAERWLTIHPTSSFTGLTLYYMDIVMSEKELIGNDRRLLIKRLSDYSKRLLG